MVYCPACKREMSVAECTFGATGLTCKKCGARTESDTVKDEATITDAVRSYTANASAAERNGKTGQQQWGLFETNYQREKGITTEQSLQEIEHAAKYGITGAANSTQFDMAKSTRTGGADSLLAPPTSGTARQASPASSSAQIPVALGGAAATLPAPGSTGPKGKTFASAEPRSEFRSRVQQSNAPLSGGGAAFLANFKAKEAAKFKPGFRG